MRDILLTILVFGAIPFMIARPSIGLLVWSWLGYMNPHRMTWGFAYAFPFVQVAAGATFVGLLFSREKVRFPWTPVTVVWLMWALWTCVTTFFALNPVSAELGWERSIKVQAMILATLLLMGSREKLNQLTWVIVASIGFFGIKGGLFTAATGGVYRVWGPPGSFIEGNNELALALLMIVPLMRYLQTQSRNRWVRGGLIVGMVLSAFAIVGSYSRGALVGGAVMVLMLWLKSRHKLMFGIPLFLTAVLATSFMPEKWMERMGTIGEYTEDSSAMGRINAWHFAWNLASDHPVVGGGFNTFTRDLFHRYAPDPEAFHDAHSIYFQVLAEHGFVGLILFVLLGFLTLRTAGWVIRAARDRPDLLWARDLAAMMQVGFVGYAVGGIFLGLAYFDLPYHLMTIAVLAKVAVQDALRAPVPQTNGALDTQAASPAAPGMHR
ncbi:MAG TPA: putative O-glycosylation ligase, exosortase A system-associated [Steroidobacteraceae bacterium]|nr:putative O-glycosylation ligase, exosortase A system-associated [Steroidobacteraceae bacterium]